MASFVTNIAADRIWDGTDDWLTDTIKVGLSTSVHVPNRDDDFLDEAGADDFVDGELSGTGYTAGFGGAGRKTLTGKSVVVDDPNDRAEFDAADLLPASTGWPGLNAGTIAQIVPLKEVTADTDSPPLMNIDNAPELPLVTNGGNVGITWNAEGVGQLRTA
jgi:hypothetical protein